MSTPSDKSTAQKGTRKGSKSTTKKSKQADDASFTTGRFRLSQYSATPNDGPPLLHGQGPYASVYRAPVPPAEVAPPGPESSSSPAPNSGTRIIMTDPSPKTTRRSSKPQPTQPTTTPVQDDLANASPTQSRARSGYTIRVPASSQPTQPIISPPANSIPRASVPPSAPLGSLPAAPGPTHSSTSHPPTTHYRRNYEYDSQASRPDPSRPPPTSIQMSDTRSTDVTMAPPPPELSVSQPKGKEREISGQRAYYYRLRSRPFLRHTVRSTSPF